MQRKKYKVLYHILSHIRRKLSLKRPLKVLIPVAFEATEERYNNVGAIFCYFDGDMKKFYDDGINKIFVAIGDNKLRKKLQDQAIAIGFEVINAVSKFSRISSRASLGKGICIMAGAIVNVNCRIGDGCIINTNCSIDHDCEIADFVHVAPGTAISGTTSVGQGTHIGTNSSVIDGTVIGEWSYIGAGAAVVKNIGSHVMAYGVPAREIRSLKE